MLVDAVAAAAIADAVVEADGVALTFVLIAIVCCCCIEIQFRCWMSIGLLLQAMPSTNQQYCRCNVLFNIGCSIPYGIQYIVQDFNLYFNSLFLL